MQTVQKRVHLQREIISSGMEMEGRTARVSLPCEPWNVPGATVEARRGRMAEVAHDLESLVPVADRRAEPTPPVVVVKVHAAAPVSSLPPTVQVAKSRHDPAVNAAREAIRAAYDGKRTTKRIAELTGINRRTVFDHLRAMGLAPIKGQAGPSDDNPSRKKALARRATVKLMVADGKSGPQIAEYLGVKVSTIHADCISLGVKIPKGTGRGPETTKRAREASLAKRQEQARQGRITKAQADFERATEKAVAALKALGVGRDDIAEQLRAVVRGITA